MAVWFVARAYAQTSSPQFLITWKSTTYVPPDYAGKVLPTADSSISVSFELVDNGRPADLSGQNVYWYLNGNFLQGGIGLQRIVFRAPQQTDQTLDLRIEVPNYKTGSQLKTIEIPVVSPQAVIESSYPDDAFSSSPLELSAKPYFFNVRGLSEISFSWNVNGEIPSSTDNPSKLSLNLENFSGGNSVNVSVGIKNKIASPEIAVKNKTLNYAR